MAPPTTPVLAPPSQPVSSFSLTQHAAGQSIPKHETQRHSYTDIPCWAQVIAHPLHRDTSQSLKAQSATHENACDAPSAHRHRSTLHPLPITQLTPPHSRISTSVSEHRSWH